jgi:Restriction endonuclease
MFGDGEVNMSRGYRYHQSNRQPYQLLDDQWDRYESYIEELTHTVDETTFDPLAVVEFIPWDNEADLDEQTDRYKRLFLLPHAFRKIQDETLFNFPVPPKQIEVADPPQLMLEKSAYPPVYFQSLNVGSSEKTLFHEAGRKLGAVLSAFSSNQSTESVSGGTSETEKINEIYAYEKQRQYRLSLLQEVDALRQKVRSRNQENIEKREQACEEYKLLTKSTSPEAVQKTFEILHRKYPLPNFLRTRLSYHIDQEDKVCLIEFEFPDYTNQTLVVGWSTSRGYTDINKPKFASNTTKKKLVKQCLCSLLLRHAFLASTSNSSLPFTHVAVNAIQTWFDPATGQQRTGVVGSLFASIQDVSNLDLSKLDPELSVRHLKGLLTPSFDSVNPVRPIYTLDRNDDRLVRGKNIDESLSADTNLAAIDWEDFEHLVAQILEWEFLKNGVEVRVTRASRDRGVDAILFDPDPLRGGKFVVQAKRYTKTVDVSAVRDLYGTVMNEGANRGILITTASYGPDSYDFVKDKPISLVDGQNLLLLLQKHGRKYRINLEEARAQQQSNYKNFLN